MQEPSTSYVAESYPGFRNCLRQTWHQKRLQEETTEVMIASLTESSAKQYNSVLKHWWSFYQQWILNPFRADEEAILQCLTSRFSEGANYSTLNTLRSAIFLINDQQQFSNSCIVQRFFKGIYKLCPPTPRYESTWYVDTVFDKLEEWSPFESLDLRKLSLKAAMLSALGSAFRV